MRGFIGIGRAVLVTAVVVAGLSAVYLVGCGDNVITPRVGEPFEYGGQTYKTVKIGSQTWMAENLNYPTLSGSWCYDNKESNCKIYGRLYNWDTAKTVCPAGWRLPQWSDWQKLADKINGHGNKLKAKNGWDDSDGKSGNGSDDYGFSALPAGARTPDDVSTFYNPGSFWGVGDFTGWWTATAYDTDSASIKRMSSYIFVGLSDDEYNKGYGLSVRCVQNN